jgi:hypothetical protein
MANTSTISTSDPIAGTAFVTTDGVTRRLGGRCSYSPARVERTTKGGLSGIYGFNEKPRAPFIEFTVVDSGGTRVEDFADMVAETVTIELINGKLVTGNNMWTTTPSEVDAAEGEFTVRFEGGTIREDTTA